MLKTYAIYDNNGTCFDKGKVINIHNDTLLHLALVQSMDYDLIGKDEDLGSTYTKEDGVLTISFKKK